MVPFAGFDLPLQYEGIVAEHNRVRNAVGLFDVSHMGEVLFSGARAGEVLQRITTNDVVKPGSGHAIYTPICYPHGGIVDDMIVYKKSDNEFLICVNAANRKKDVEWFAENAKGECEVKDLSDEYSQIAVQGPAAPALLSRVFGEDISGMKPFTFQSRRFDGAEVILATTGYTGERGGEIYVENRAASAVWNALLDKGRDLDVGPVGLGARDTLRVEMKYCLYGNDIDETTTPLEAGIGWTVKLDKGEFLGRDALVRQKEKGLSRRLMAFIVEEKGIPRHGYGIYIDDKRIGEVTSGTLSPSLKVPVGIGYIAVPYDTEGAAIEFDMKGLRRVQARVVKDSLYSPKR